MPTDNENRILDQESPHFISLKNFLIIEVINLKTKGKVCAHKNEADSWISASL